MKLPWCTILRKPEKPERGTRGERNSLLKKNLRAGIVLGLLLSILNFHSTSAQSSICGGATPTFTVNLTSSMNASYISPNVTRADTCCGATNPDVCVHFVIFLNPASTGVIFDIYSGAVPPGALFYQINCGPPIPVGQPICLTGPGPYDLTFCKPGNNSNQFSIQAIPNITISNDITVNDGCTGMIFADGFDEATLTWNSVYPGPASTYNSYLSCSAGCDTVMVTGTPGMPSYVDYMVCGLIAGGCDSVPHCDTVRVYFNPTLAVNIVPANPTVCFGSPGTTITATPSGGSPPYIYQWSNGATTASNFVGAGTYTVTISDSTNCPAATASVTVTSFTAVITANAGADMMVCASSPSVTLNGSVTGVITGVWTGGSGSYSPSNTALNATYTPSASEIAAGTVTLTLTTTNNGTCPPDTDWVMITINNFTAIIDPGASNVTCNGFNNGTASVNLSGGNPPFTYWWSTSPPQTTQVATNLSPGTYTCVITDANGCTGSATVQITQPPPLNMNAAGFPTSCYNLCNGQTVVIPSGGSGGYSYLWQPGNITSAAATNLCPGTYTITVTDIGGCTLTDTVLVTQPSPVVTSMTSSPTYCNQSMGSADITASGGTGSYTYAWMPGNQTTSSISGLPTGTYTCTVTDGNGCTASNSISVGNSPGPTLTTVSSTPPLCTASCDGSITVSASSGFPPYQYNWLTAPPQTGTTATNLCSGTYSVIVSDSYGCTDTSTVSLTAPTPVTLTPGPTATICIGQQTLLTATASGGTPGYSYTWTPAGPLVSPTVNTTYSVIATDANGCSSTSQQVSVLVYPPVNAAISGNTIACSNTQVTLVGNGGGGNGGPYTYQWQPGNYSGQNYTVNPFSTTTYTLIVSDGCSPVATATFTVTVPPDPVASFTFSDSTACGQACVDFVNTTPNVQSLYWLFSDGFNSTADSLQHCFGTGTFNATLIATDNNGCHDTVTIPNFLTVHANPVASFTLGPQPTTVLEPNICFTDHSSADAITWYWNFDDPNDQTTSTDQNTCHAYSDTGTYCATLIVTNQYGCFSVATNCLMIEPYYTLWVPNAFTPNNDGINDVFFPVGNDVDPDHFEMTIYDRWGNLIFKTDNWGIGWDGTVNNSSKMAQIDTYVWKINCWDHAGFKHKMIGKVSLIK